jgi:hypothetical protein
MMQIHDSDSFAANVAREKARRERYGVGFALVSIKTGARRWPRRISKAMSRIARTRLRSTDCVGWMDEGSLGVLLPETDAAGAQKVAQDISERITKAVGSQPVLETTSI